MLEVDNRVIIPELTHTRIVISAADVIHSYACPSLGIKADAYPGRLNQASVYINRLVLSLDNVQRYVVFYIVLCL